MINEMEKKGHDKATLFQWLQTALELEFATIPPYLIALLSIRLPSNREAAELIRSVMIEEMLHFALVANVLNAVGGEPSLDRTVVPQYPLELAFQGVTFSDRKFPINLAPFKEDTIKTFMRIEEPLRPVFKEAMPFSKIEVPGLTIGDFYARILDLLEELEESTPETIFTGRQERQIHEGYYWSGGGKIVAVHDLTTSKEALQIVISQGEGAWHKTESSHGVGFGQPFQMGHYYRFSEIFYAHRYRRSDDPNAPPTGDAIKVDYSNVYPIQMNPRGSAYKPGSTLALLNDAFNRRYTIMLLQLQEAISGTPKSLYNAIMDSMHQLTPIAHEMMKCNIDGDAEGHTGCPTFEWNDE